MKFAGRVVRLFSMLGILSIGLTTVAQAAGADRKAAREERENRVSIAVKARSSSKSTAKVSTKVVAVVSRSEKAYVQRLVSAAQYNLKYQKGVLAAENRLIANQNRIIRELNVAVNPTRIANLTNTATALQTSIDRDLTYLTAVQPTINSTIGALQAFVGVVPGIGATFNRLVTAAVVTDQTIAVIAARPPYGIPPATPVT